MGWAAGSVVCCDIWNPLRKMFKTEKEKVKALSIIISALTDSDWDCVDEIVDEWPEARKAIKKALPGYLDEENE